MAFDFPASPTVGQSYSPVPGTLYTWNGYAWAAVIATAAPGFPVQIARVDVSSAVAAVSFTSGIDATYDEYEIHFFNVSMSNPGGIGAQVSIDGGANWRTGTEYQRFFHYVPASAPGTPGSDTGSVSAAFVQMDVGQITAEPQGRMYGRLSFAIPTNTTTWKPFLFSLTGHNSSTGLYSSHGGGFWQNVAAYNAIRLINNGGNITNGSFVLYGIKK